MGSPLLEHHRLLDFGVGWGRICRFFLRELPLANIYGADVNSELVEICSKTFKSSNFFTSPVYPPTDLPDGEFNLIVGYSVFSHLSENACRSWMYEFHRLLAPGGIVAITTRGRDFFDFCESMKYRQATGYLKALSEMFEDFDEARRRYDSGEFVHCNHHGVSGGGVLNAGFYGESFIPESYARHAYSDRFTLEKFLFEAGITEHPILFFKKKA